MAEVPIGFCQCGCGQKTKLSPQNHTARGLIKGEPQKFIKGHSGNRNGENNSRWKGGRKLSSMGYVLIYMPSHPRSDKKGYVLEHILIVEAVLGKSLPNGAMVHHHDSRRGNNGNRNLVVCQDDAYHQLIHKRTRAFQACGNVNWRKCNYCKKYDDPKKLVITKKGSIYHSSCVRLSQRNQWRLKRIKEGKYKNRELIERFSNNAFAK
jgi:hypothetical protein